VLVPVLATLALVACLDEDRPTHPAPKTLADYTAVLKIGDTGWLCFFYAVTFGGFVGLVSFLGIFFRDQYALTNVQAGAFAMLCALTASMIPPSGRLPVGSARRHPGTDLGLYRRCRDDGGRVGPASAGSLHSTARDGHELLGMGNGAVFQLVAQRFPGEIGVITGLVGAAGGSGDSCSRTLSAA
jgi:MFS transporter, NNP family, nitrate/nitrite transporter